MSTQKRIDRYCIFDYVILKKLFNSPNKQNLLILYMFYYLRTKENIKTVTTEADILKAIPSFTKEIVEQTIAELIDLELLIEHSRNTYSLAVVCAEFENNIFVPILD